MLWIVTLNISNNSPTGVPLVYKMLRYASQRRKLSVSDYIMLMFRLASHDWKSSVITFLP